MNVLDQLNGIKPVEKEPEEPKYFISKEDKTKSLRDLSPESRKKVQQELKERLHKQMHETTLRLRKEKKTLDDVLTEEHLKDWLVNKEMTYWDIAANYAGCDPTLVAKYAGKYNLKSSKAIKTTEAKNLDEKKHISYAAIKKNIQYKKENKYMSH